MRRFFILTIICTGFVFAAGCGVRRASCDVEGTIKSELRNRNPRWTPNSNNFSVTDNGGKLNIFLCGKEVFDLSPLSNFDFDTVFLIDANISDLEFLSKSRNLRVLIIVRKEPKPMRVDVSALEGKKLEKLGLQNINVINAHVTEGMAFKSLHFTSVTGVDFSKLKNLKDLESFSVQKSHIGTVGFLSGCRKIKYIDLTGSIVDDISPVRHLLNRKKEFRIITN